MSPAEQARVRRRRVDAAEPTTAATLNFTQRRHLEDVASAYFVQRIIETGSAGDPEAYVRLMLANPGLLGLTASTSYMAFFDAVAAHLHSTFPLQNAPVMDALAWEEDVGLHLFDRYAAQIKARLKPDEEMPSLTWDVYLKLRDIPDALAELQATIAHLDAVQADIEKYIVNTEVATWDVLGQGGNEGSSHGAHVHMQVVDITNGGSSPVNLFAWANTYQEGIEATAEFDGRGKLTMHYDDSAGTLVNDAERIALVRRDGENLAIIEKQRGECGLWPACF